MSGCAVLVCCSCRISHIPSYAAKRTRSLASTVSLSIVKAESNSISLIGEWFLALDFEGKGDGPAWASRQEQHRVNLPGSLDVQGIGVPISVETQWTATIFDRSFYEAPSFEKYRQPGQVKVPFCLQPETKFAGPAWYSRCFTVPSNWTVGRSELFLERPHWATRVWLDDVELGGGDSLSVPHCSSLGELEPGRAYSITLCVDNHMVVEVGENAHSVSDHTQGNWNGIVGDIQIRKISSAGFESFRVISASQGGSVRVRGKLAEVLDRNDVSLAVFECGVDGTEALQSRRIEMSEIDGEGCFDLTFNCGPGLKLWDEFSPSLYRIVGSSSGCSREIEFGFRDFAIEGTQFTINGRRTFLRGVLDCCIFPKTGHPPMDVEAWDSIFSRIKECGFNHVRFHSWCPPEAAFVAGDRLGVYLQVECAVWPNAEAVLGFNSPKGIGDGASVDEWAIREGERILEAYGHHPSFVMLACGNEPGGSRHREYLSDWIEHFRSIEAQCLITGCAGWPALQENQFHVVPDPRIHQWGDGLECRLNGQAPHTLHDYQSFVEEQDRPIVSHEIGQWCSYPSVSSVSKYDGHLRPRSYEIILDSLAEKDLEDLSDDFQYASGKLQTLCYKEEIESSLRTAGLAGFQLLGLQDFPGQGTAPVGLLDAFWEKKSYCEFDEIKRFCSSTVLLARLKKRVFSSGEKIEASIEVAYYGASPLRDEEWSWSLVDEDGRVLQQSKFTVDAVGLGLSELGRISIDLPAVEAAYKLRLVVGLTCEGSVVENDWNAWVYPELCDASGSDSVRRVSDVCEALALLDEGETVLLATNQVANNIALGFSPIFWNTACTQGQAPHTLGILCDPQHPAFAEFPTDSFTDWQWWYLLHGSGALQLDDLPSNLEPIVRVIDDWTENRKLGLLFEAKVGRGKLMVCSAALFAPERSLEESLVRQQFQSSILRYMDSDSFEPTDSLTANQVKALFANYRANHDSP